MKNDGFTLMELIVVVSVIAILAGIVVPVVGLIMDEARIAKMQTEVDTLAKACLMYNHKNGYMPYAGIGNANYAYVNPGNVGRMNTLNNLIAPYLSKRLVYDPWGSNYYYHHYIPYANLDTVVGSIGPDRAQQTWSGTVWNNRTEAGDDYYKVFK